MSDLTTAVKLHISNATSFKKTTTHPNMETLGKAVQNYIVILC